MGYSGAGEKLPDTLAQLLLIGFSSLERQRYRLQGANERAETKQIALS